MINKFSKLITEDSRDASDFLPPDQMVVVHLASMGIESGYTINDDLSVDVTDRNGVTIKKQDFSKLPVRFGRVDKWFLLHDLKNLTTLEGCPQEVNGFQCRQTKITSLEGCPTITHGGSFNVIENKLTSLIGSPTQVAQMHCDYNELTDLKGSPDIVGGGRAGTSGIFNCTSNNITSLEFGPKEVSHNYLIRDCPIHSLEGFECEFGGDFYYDGTPLFNIFPMDKFRQDDLNSFRMLKVVKERTVNFKRLRYAYSIFGIDTPTDLEDIVLNNGYTIV
jgi:hypothetical protein